MNNEIQIDGVTYVRKDSIKINEIPEKVKNCTWCLVRTYSAGVFYGLYDTKKQGKEGVVYQARRVYYWDGACSLSQLAIDGTSKPDLCKFPAPVDEVFLKEIIEVIPLTVKAKKSLDIVKIWKI